MKILVISLFLFFLGGVDNFWTSFYCAGAIIEGGAAIYGTGGIAAGVVCNIAAAACGSLLGSGK